MRDLEKLVSLCPPAHAPTSGFAEGRSHWVIPPSHRELIANYGPGCFDDFLWVYAEGVEHTALDIPTRTEEIRSMLSSYPNAEIQDILDEYGVAVGDLVLWGVTDNADFLMWLPVGQPDEWPTLIIGHRHFRSMVMFGTSTSILLGLLTGALVARSFPDDFPGEFPEFSPET